MTWEIGWPGCRHDGHLLSQEKCLFAKSAVHQLEIYWLHFLLVTVIQHFKHPTMYFSTQGAHKFSLPVLVSIFEMYYGVCTLDFLVGLLVSDYPAVSQSMLPVLMTAPQPPGPSTLARVGTVVAVYTGLAQVSKSSHHSSSFVEVKVQLIGSGELAWSQALIGSLIFLMGERDWAWKPSNTRCKLQHYFKLAKGEKSSPLLHVCKGHLEVGPVELGELDWRIQSGISHPRGFFSYQVQLA